MGDPFRERDFSDHIECEALQPHAQITNLPCRYKALVKRGKERSDCRVYVRLEADEIAHRIDVGNWLLQRTVKVLIWCIKKAWHLHATIERLQNGIEARLLEQRVSLEPIRSVVGTGLL
ncbi:MAG: hypothetical protein Q9214_001930 [Letrouitia sp. 1 TL-2023]